MSASGGRRLFRPGPGRRFTLACQTSPWAKRIAKPEGFDGGLDKSRAMTYLTHDLRTTYNFKTVVSELLRHLDRACKDQQPKT
jgi:hypothetical protein